MINEKEYLKMTEETIDSLNESESSTETGIFQTEKEKSSSSNIFQSKWFIALITVSFLNLILFFYFQSTESRSLQSNKANQTVYELIEEDKTFLGIMQTLLERNESLSETDQRQLNELISNN